MTDLANVIVTIVFALAGWVILTHIVWDVIDLLRLRKALGAKRLRQVRNVRIISKGWNIK